MVNECCVCVCHIIQLTQRVPLYSSVFETPDFCTAPWFWIGLGQCSGWCVNMFVLLYCDMSRKSSAFSRVICVFKDCGKTLFIAQRHHWPITGWWRWNLLAEKICRKKSSLQRDFISGAWIHSLGDIKPGKNTLQNLSEPRYKLPSESLKAEPANILHKNINTYHMPFLRLQHCSNGHWGLLGVQMVCKTFFTPWAFSMMAVRQIIILITASRTTHFQQLSSA